MGIVRYMRGKGSRGGFKSDIVEFEFGRVDMGWILSNHTATLLRHLRLVGAKAWHARLNKAGPRRDRFKRSSFWSWRRRNFNTIIMMVSRTLSSAHVVVVSKVRCSARNAPNHGLSMTSHGLVPGSNAPNPTNWVTICGDIEMRLKIAD